MPELPEVETTLRGIEPFVTNHQVNKINIRQARLRWVVPTKLPLMLEGLKFHKINRRGKYLLFENDHGYMIIHLGMSGSLRIVEADELPGKHDHVDFCFSAGHILRFKDPRRFGCVLWQDKSQTVPPLLLNLGPEPLSDNFEGKHLFLASRKRSISIKPFIMDSKIVVGVGNIYANEALFLAKINPKISAGRVSLQRYERLVFAIKEVLKEAISAGGTTLRDFKGSDGSPGYFKQKLNVYGRGGKKCISCRNTLREIKLSQRSTVYCNKCQR